MENKNYIIDDDLYYRELQSAARSYNTKLWTIPGLFGGLIGLIVTNLNFPEFFIRSNIYIELKNTIILFIGCLFGYVLILHFYKAHFYHLSIQKKIDKFDNIFNTKQCKNLERISLESTSDIKIKKRICELEFDKEDKCDFTYLQKYLITEQVSPWVKRIMIIFLVSMILTFFCSLSFLSYSSIINLI